MQATLTKFVYLSPAWQQNCEEERLLGVSLTGMLDHPVLSSVSEEAASWLQEMSKVVTDTNTAWAAKLGINKAAAARCFKPSGTVSQLVDSSSGVHARYAPYYIRRVRADEKDPLAQVMKQQGFVCEQDVMQPSNLVFSFPVKAPGASVFRDDRTALEQLEYWLMLRTKWCDGHNVSITVFVKEEEWLEVGAWVYKNFDDVCGISFLPHSNHSYRQAPYEEITEEQYEALVSVTPTSIDYEALGAIEKSDMTTSSREFACTSGSCDLI